MCCYGVDIGARLGVHSQSTSVVSSTEKDAALSQSFPSPQAGGYIRQPQSAETLSFRITLIRSTRPVIKEPRIETGSGVSI